LKPRSYASCLVFIAFALGAQAQTPNPILQPGHPWAFDGFALIPPAGDWASLSKTRTRGVFAQKPKADGSTALATVVSERVEAGFGSAAEFLAHMRGRRGNAIDPDRYRILRHAEELEPAERWCTRYATLGTEQDSFLAGAWFIELVGRSCWHTDARLIVDMTVSRRSRSGGDDLEGEPSDAAFLAGLQLRPLEPLGTDPQGLREQAEAGNFVAALRLATMYELGQGIAADLKEGERWYRYAAEAGEVDAQYNLGLFYIKGVAGKPDVEQGLHWLARAADQRDAQAQFNLGLLFFQGELLQPNFEEAYYWFRAAAANGHERAKRYLRAPLPGSEKEAPASAPEAAPAQ
jgi:hypothetical protein